MRAVLSLYAKILEGWSKNWRGWRGIQPLCPLASAGEEVASDDFFCTTFRQFPFKAFKGGYRAGVTGVNIVTPSLKMYTVYIYYKEYHIYKATLLANESIGPRSDYSNQPSLCFTKQNQFIQLF